MDFLQSSVGIICIGIVGLFIGSFLNVVIYRLPIMMTQEDKQYAWQTLYPDKPVPEDIAGKRFNLAVPRSRCPHCGHLISAWENMPLLSWLLLRGKCKSCKQPISLRYPLVELITGVMSALVVWQIPDAVPLAFALVFTWGIIALIFIDADCQLLPDRIVLPLMWLGIFAAWYHAQFVNLETSVLGAMVGYLLLWSVYWIFKLITGKEGMGYGDFKLLACLCAWQGLWMLPVILVLAAVAGLIYAVATGLGRGKPMAFGPFLGIAGWVTFLFGGKIAVLLGFYAG